MADSICILILAFTAKNSKHVISLLPESYVTHFWKKPVWLYCLASTLAISPKNWLRDWPMWILMVGWPWKNCQPIRKRNFRNPISANTALQSGKASRPCAIGFQNYNHIKLLEKR